VAALPAETAQHRSADSILSGRVESLEDEQHASARLCVTAPLEKLEPHVEPVEALLCLVLAGESERVPRIAIGDGGRRARLHEGPLDHLARPYWASTIVAWGASTRSWSAPARPGRALRNGMASKMATGSGKTVVMAMLIAWLTRVPVADMSATTTSSVLTCSPRRCARQSLQWTLRGL
jgi:hypothetical protein